MGNVAKKICLVVIAALCFFAVKEVVNTSLGSRAVKSELSESYKNDVRKEYSESGVDAGVAEKILASVQDMQDDKQTVDSVTEAYGNFQGKTIKELRIHLDSNPARKSAVGFALVKQLEAHMGLPMQLDEFTVLTGLHYDESGEAVVYHYAIADEIVDQYLGDMDALQKIAEELNPDAVCKTSLDLLGQGFDMAYSYRDTRGNELFEVVRSHQDCQRLGFTKYS